MPLPCLLLIPKLFVGVQVLSENSHPFLGVILTRRHLIRVLEDGIHTRVTMFKERSFLSAQAVTIIPSVNKMNNTIHHLQNREHYPWALTIRKAKMNPPREKEGKLHLQTTTPITTLRP
jgi:hypothetical protein